MKAAKWREFTDRGAPAEARELNEEIFNLPLPALDGMAKNPSAAEPGAEGSSASPDGAREKKGGSRG